MGRRSSGGPCGSARQQLDRSRSCLLRAADACRCLEVVTVSTAVLPLLLLVLPRVTVVKDLHNGGMTTFLSYPTSRYAGNMLALFVWMCSCS